MLEQELEAMRQVFCDKYCKYPYICESEEEIDGICEECPLNKLAEVVNK